jgi:hypothetical protein
MVIEDIKDDPTLHQGKLQVKRALQVAYDGLLPNQVNTPVGSLVMIKQQNYPLISSLYLSTPQPPLEEVSSRSSTMLKKYLQDVIWKCILHVIQ